MRKRLPAPIRTWAQNYSNVLSIRIRNTRTRLIFGNNDVSYWIDLFDYILLITIRSLGCVLFEMIFLQRAFSQEQRSNPDIPNCGNFFLFTPILKRFYFYSFLHFLYGSKFKIELLKNAWKKSDERIDSNKLLSEKQILSKKHFWKKWIHGAIKIKILCAFKTFFALIFIKQFNNVINFSILKFV